ncbi:MAG: transposase [Candidatus Heimdallarchaeum endolithica]|uniref:Transposase n=1 Tax=Candidatus Heimdallarchaeum endolithica TaxID=2876572 RepID=A0A9Y1FQA9_9ARCH|nr:MAG: transposase [Candidatus Heimdallarchaeum endolithica]
MGKRRTKENFPTQLFWKIHLIVGLPSRAIVSLAHSASNTHDSKVFGLLWQKLPSALLKPFLRFYGDCNYWTENIVGLLKQHSFFPIIPPKSDTRYPSPPLPGPIVQAHRLYPSLYRHNHHPEYRSSVKHVFGLVSSNSLFPRSLIVYPLPFFLPCTVLSLLQLPFTPSDRLVGEKEFWTCFIYIILSI